MNNNKKANRLINEKSPYLLQHAYNPIDWYTWDTEAFEKAKAEDKPIFLSIGYSCCTWCHVMEKESFEDEEVAELLNKHFISIKVDREERPDVDSVYMEIAQALNGSAGWPLTIIMNAEQVPFFAGTYIPKHGNGRYRGLVDLLGIVNDKWQNARESLLEAIDKVKNFASYLEDNKSLIYLDDSIIDEAFHYLKESFDVEFGGFGKAPKFPSPHNIMYLLRYSIMKKEPSALEMLNKTLTSMYKGGIYDHIGFGFSRYSTDQQWLIPHFEKMLYDNALLTIAYTESYLHTRNELYKKIAKETLAFIEVNMIDQYGGFYTAIDADSEGIEGKYYLWTIDELKAVLSPDEVDFIIHHYNITKEGNFLGSNVLNLLHIPDEQVLSFDTEELKRIKNKLLIEREKRVHPHLDDKILTANNAMMIIAFIHAYTAYNDEKYLKIAIDAIDFILESLVDCDGRLLARYRDGEAKYLANSNDYAYLIWALLDIFLATSKLEYLTTALKLNDDLYERFYDHDQGGFFQTASDAEKLLFRYKEIYDGAIPSSNSVITMNLIRLAEISDEPNYEALAVKQFQTFAESITSSPTSHMYMLSAYIMYKVAKRKIVLIVDEINDEVKKLQRIVRNKCVPCTQMITLLREDIKDSEIFAYYLEDEHPFALHVCENYSCNEPIYDFEEMEEELTNLILARLS